MANVFGHEVDRVLETNEDLRSVYKHPSKFVSGKVIDHIDPLTERFLAKTTLAFLATRRPNGEIDQTPRGDPPGFIHVLDPKTIVLPDRPGNNRVDAFENLMHDPHVGLICVIPGHKDTLRISGEARLIEDAKLGEQMAVKGKPAKLLLLIEVHRVLCHCPKAFIRANAWDSDKWPDTTDVPTLAEMMIAHGKIPISHDDMDAIITEDRRTRLY